jgi:hypothetical protein
MKRFVAVLAGLGLVGLSLMTASPALAAERVVTAHYDAPAAGSATAGGGCPSQPPQAASGCPSFPTNSNETSMSIEITDDGGSNVAASASWDTDGDGISDTGFDFCGKTDAPQPIPPGTVVNVFVWGAPSADCPDGHATTGDVKATIISSGGGGPTIAALPKPTLKFSSLTPKKGSTVKGKAGLKVCNSKTQGTKIQLQKKVGSSYKTIKTQKLNSKCKTIFKVKAKFKKATFRSYWKTQNKAYRTQASKTQTVVTHP